MDDTRKVLIRSRFASAPGVLSRSPVVRGQKNLSLARSDILRLSRLAERDRLSQAKQIAKALDAYEALYGRIGD